MPVYSIPDIITLSEFKNKILAWSSSFEYLFFLDNNEHKNATYHRYESVLGVGLNAEKVTENLFSDLNHLNDFLKNDKKGEWILGFLSYELKNQIENLDSENIDFIGFPAISFFIPEHLIIIQEDLKSVEIISEKADNIWKEIFEIEILKVLDHDKIELKSRFTKKEYIDTVEQIKNHIIEGDVYEINFCQEFYHENLSIDPLSVFLKLNKISPAPYASFVKMKDYYLICSSPERFLYKEASKIVSEPIKGTIRRSCNIEDDKILKQELLNSEKDRAENVMIVDLVRNDFSKCSQTGSVKVEELFGIYSFAQVHQMVSSITAELKDNTSFKEIIESTFPMGSMTGAPKIMSMKIIDQLERNQRGLFSGSVGYINANGDFDFNVVIRSILYNQKTNYLSIQVGSAIVYDSDAEKEYEECLLKARAMKMALGISVD
jgi:para-aminobenzoate synthetase component 1